MSDNKIEIQVTTDENKVPTEIHWTAPNEKIKGRSAKAMTLVFWDEENTSTMNMDLWTKEMKVDEMKFFMHQSLLTMSDTFERATGEKEMTLAMKDFCDYFAEKMDLKPPSL